MNKKKQLLKYNLKVANIISELDGVDPSTEPKKMEKICKKLWEAIMIGRYKGYEVSEKWEDAFDKYEQIYMDCVSLEAISGGQKFKSYIINKIDRRYNKSICYLLNENDVLMGVYKNIWHAAAWAIRMQFECVLGMLGIYQFAPGFESKQIYLVKSFDRLLKVTGMTEEEAVDKLNSDDEIIRLVHTEDYEVKSKEPSKPSVLSGKLTFDKEIDMDKFTEDFVNFLSDHDCSYDGVIGSKCIFMTDIPQD